ncbi:unnamed protein product, partial [Oppiella nova]
MLRYVLLVLLSVFVKHGKCLSKTVSDQKRCQNKYRVLTQSKDEVLSAVGYSRNNTRADNFQKIRQICCWWIEYQTCAVKSVIDRCGEQAAILVNEEFYKTYTSSATSRVLTYRSCLPQDRTFTYPACFLDHSIDPNSLGINFDSNELDVEDDSRTKEIQNMFANKANETNHTDFNHNIEASIYNSNAIYAKLVPHLMALVFIR